MAWAVLVVVVVLNDKWGNAMMCLYSWSITTHRQKQARKKIEKATDTILHLFEDDDVIVVMVLAEGSHIPDVTEARRRVLELRSDDRPELLGHEGGEQGGGVGEDDGAGKASRAQGRKRKEEGKKKKRGVTYD